MNNLSTSNIDNLFTRIEVWNEKRDHSTFGLHLEVRLLAEELFELAGFSREDAKEKGIEFADQFVNSNNKTDTDAMLDAAGDITFIAIGTMHKIINTFNIPTSPEKVLKDICDANDYKGLNKDSTGKIIKDQNFVEPKHV